MTRRRLEELIDGQLRPVDPEPPLLSSAQSAWSGFPLERNVARDGGAATIAFPSTELILVAVGSIYVKYRACSTRKGFLADVGTVTIWPAGHESRPAAWTAPRNEGCVTEMLRVQLNLAALERIAPEFDLVEELRLSQLDQQSGVDDPSLGSLMRLMEMDVAAGCPTGKLYGESLSLALAAHVAGRYSTVPMEAPPRDGLSPPVLGRVLDYIRANLGSDLTIAELAAVANMSPQHFCLRFRQSVGVAPHQWVTRARVREAERLLRARRMSIAEVALSLGFASQSHFTDVFRRMTGTTPKRFQWMR